MGDNLSDVADRYKSSPNEPLVRAGIMNRRQIEMKRHRRVLAAAGALLFAFSADAALAQKQGGILRVPHFDSPASMSLLEESTVAVNRPMMGVFNNLVMYKQDVPQNSLKSIVPDLAASWAWNEEGTFPLRQGVKWHDGKPFTAKTSNAPGISLPARPARSSAFNPRNGWYSNLAEVTTMASNGPSSRICRRAPWRSSPGTG